MCSLCNKDSVQGLGSLSIEELLEQQEKPVFIVDLQALPSRPTYFNPHLRSIESLEQRILNLWIQADLFHILGEGVILSPASYWCAALAGDVDGVANALIFEGIKWVTYTIGKRYRIITGDTLTFAPDHKTFATSKDNTPSNISSLSADLPTNPAPYIPGDSLILPVMTPLAYKPTKLLTFAAPRL